MENIHEIFKGVKDLVNLVWKTYNLAVILKLQQKHLFFFSKLSGPYYGPYYVANSSQCHKKCLKNSMENIHEIFKGVKDLVNLVWKTYNLAVILKLQQKHLFFFSKLSGPYYVA